MSEAHDPFSYELPCERIAQRPVYPYHSARMLHLDRSQGIVADRTFEDLPRVLRPGDLLIFNDTKVLPARLFGQLQLENHDRREVEVLLLESMQEAETREVWRCLGKPLKKFTRGARIAFLSGLRGVVIERPSSEDAIIEFSSDAAALPVRALLEQQGTMPIPPYIRSGRGDAVDRTDYQTLFAKVQGSIAAPTASLHFTQELLAELAKVGVEQASVTLHVGLSSIRPVLRDGEVQTPSPERMVVSRELLQKIREVRAAERRVIAVGTTVVRAIESAFRVFAEHPGLEKAEAKTDLFITPGFKFLALDAIVTNFHQPGTTHLLLVEAFMGRRLLADSYAHALRSEYRFLSYGDGMLIT